MLYGDGLVVAMMAGNHHLREMQVKLRQSPSYTYRRRQNQGEISIHSTCRQRKSEKSFQIVQGESGIKLHCIYKMKQKRERKQKIEALESIAGFARFSG